jgi:hypothetical protein
MTLTPQLEAFRDTMWRADADILRHRLIEHDDFKSDGDERGEVLIHAIMSGSLQAIAVLMERGVRLTREQAKRQALMPHAAMNLDLCRMLVDLGVDASEPDVEGITALHRAVIFAREDICAYLLGAGANPNAFSSGNRTPLHHVTLVTNPTSVELARALVAAGASASVAPTDPPADYLTPFQLFCKDARRAVVEHFIEQGTEDLDQTTLDGRSLDEIVDDEQTRAILLTGRTRLHVDAGIAGDSATQPTQTRDRSDSSPKARSFGPL